MPFSKKIFIDSLKIAKIFYFLFILSLFFPIRYVFPTESAFLTGIYSDFTSISLYLSDILLFFCFIFVIVSRENDFLQVIKNLKFWIFWLILALIWQFFTGFSALNAFFFLKMLELIVLYGTTAVLFQKLDLKKPLLAFFAILAALQSTIALLQFYLQHPIGLNKLGEQIVLPQIIGIAKLIVDGTTYIRGYGTFPHPNLLSAFLIVGIFVALYLLMQKSRWWERGLYGFLLVLNIFGLTVTFSRAAFLALCIGLLVYFGYSLFNGKHSNDSSPLGRRRMEGGLILVVISILISFLIFKPFLLTRATISDSASLERMFYNKVGIRMITDNPIFGMGAGESVLHMEQYSNVKLWPWQKQPIHNYYLLAAAELGIVGSLILIWVFLSHLFGIWNLKILNLFKNWKLEIRNLQTNLYRLALFVILLSFLILMMFDHYFYTLQQTQMLLWLILGLIAVETQYKNPPPKIGGG